MNPFLEVIRELSRRARERMSLARFDDFSLEPAVYAWRLGRFVVDVQRNDVYLAQVLACVDAGLVDHDLVGEAYRYHRRCVDDNTWKMQAEVAAIRERTRQGKP